MELQSVLDYGLAETAELLRRGFEDYVVPISFDLGTLLYMVYRDGINVASSRVVLRDGKGAGVALIARRGWTSRLAGMALVPEARGQGVGRWLMGQLIEQAQAWGERAMVLEVIEQNVPAVRLYERYGFRVMRRLFSYAGPDVKVNEPAELEEIDLRQMARLVTMYGLPDLPWQVSGESLALAGPPNKGYQLDAACVAISNPEKSLVAILSVLVEPQSRRQGQATRSLCAVMAAHPGKTWQVPALCPEEIGGLFERVGFKRDTLTQLQMVIVL